MKDSDRFLISDIFIAQMIFIPLDFLYENSARKSARKKEKQGGMVE
jgi:hypothetical protein